MYKASFREWAVVVTFFVFCLVFKAGASKAMDTTVGIASNYSLDIFWFLGAFYSYLVGNRGVGANMEARFKLQ
jgi:hypothetical protein